MLRTMDNGSSVKNLVRGQKGLLIATLALCAVASAGRPAAANPIQDKYNSLTQFQRDILKNPTTGYLVDYRIDKIVVKGIPVNTPVPIAQYQEFQGGAIYWDFSASTYVMFSGNYGKWKELGGSSGVMGRPVTDEVDAGDNRGSYIQFQNGYIAWSPQTGVHEVWGEIAEEWAVVGGILGFGYPVTGVVALPTGGAYVQFASNKTIYWGPRTGAHAVFGVFLDKYATLHWEWGQLGYPRSDLYAIPNGGVRQDFEKGILFQYPGLPVQVGNY